MHDIAMAALSVFLTQSSALLAPAPTRPACRSAPWERSCGAVLLGARASRPQVGQRPTRVLKRARCPRSQEGVGRSDRLAWGDAK